MLLDLRLRLLVFLETLLLGFLDWDDEEMERLCLLVAPLPWLAPLPGPFPFPLFLLGY